MGKDREREGEVEGDIRCGFRREVIGERGR